MQKLFIISQNAVPANIFGSQKDIIWFPKNNRMGTIWENVLWLLEFCRINQLSHKKQDTY